MKDNFADGSIRKRLLDAGLRELLAHGPADFSLRRVAAAANVSCAAPYRHFKDKEELIHAVIAEIREDWVLLTAEISRVCQRGSDTHVTQLLVAGARFWIAGNNFAPFLAAAELAEFDNPIIEAIDALASARGYADEGKALTASLLSLMYGTVTLVISGRLDGDFALKNMREEISKRLEER